MDGGATKSIVRIEDETGVLLAQAQDGPANIRLSVEQAWQSIHGALQKALQPLQVSLNNKEHQFHVGMGLAGCEVKEAYQAFTQSPHDFTTLVVTSDSHTACLGAHQGEDGAIIIIGTGVVGLQIEAGKTTKVGGWGFPQDDEGGGAWLGLEAVKVALQWKDGRLPISGLATSVYEHFKDHDQLVTWSNQANSTAFAELAPLVIAQAKLGDEVAVALLKRAAEEIDRVGDALQRAQTDPDANLPCSLIGSIAPFLEPHLNKTLRARLRPFMSSPDAGAVVLVRQFLKNQKD